MKRGLLLGAVLLALCALLAVWFAQNFERRNERVRVGYQGEARYNYLLAAQRFLQRSGSSARSLGSLLQLTPLPPTSDTLVLPTSRLTLSPRLNAALRAWVQRGGELILVSWTLTVTEDAKTAAPPQSDPLLDPLGVRQYENELDDKDEDDTARVLARVTLTGRAAPLHVGFEPGYRLEDDNNLAAWSVSDAYGTHVLHYRLGAGGITVLSDFDFMTNDGIAQHDNAAFLAALVHADDHHGVVWLVYNDDMPALWRWLAEHAWPVLSALGVLLAAWMWHGMRRFGPLLPSPTLARRSLREHVRASGRFLWRHGHAARLLHSERRAVQQRIERAQPAWSALSPDDLHAHLAALAGLPAEDIRAALQTVAPRREHEFTKIVHILETLRKAL